MLCTSQKLMNFVIRQEKPCHMYSFLKQKDRNLGVEPRYFNVSSYVISVLISLIYMYVKICCPVSRLNSFLDVDSIFCHHISYCVLVSLVTLLKCKLFVGQL